MTDTTPEQALEELERDFRAKYERNGDISAPHRELFAIIGAALSRPAVPEGWRDAVEIAIDSLTKHGVGPVDLGAVTVLQAMLSAAPSTQAEQHDWQLVGKPGMYDSHYECSRCGVSMTESMDAPTPTIKGSLCNGAPASQPAEPTHENGFRVRSLGELYERMVESGAKHGEFMRNKLEQANSAEGDSE